MMEPAASYLRSHRRKSGLKQHEVAQILGSVSPCQVSRHERSKSVPGVLTAMGYEALFRTPIAELFPGLYGTVEAGIQERLAALEADLSRRKAKGREAASIARRLEWISEQNSIEPG